MVFTVNPGCCGTSLRHRGAVTDPEILRSRSSSIL